MDTHFERNNGGCPSKGFILRATLLWQFDGNEGEPCEAPASPRPGRSALHFKAARKISQTSCDYPIGGLTTVTMAPPEMVLMVAVIVAASATSPVTSPSESTEATMTFELVQDTSSDTPLPTPSTSVAVISTVSPTWIDVEEGETAMAATVGPPCSAAWNKNPRTLRIRRLPRVREDTVNSPSDHIGAIGLGPRNKSPALARHQREATACPI